MKKIESIIKELIILLEQVEKLLIKIISIVGWIIILIAVVRSST